MYPIALQGKTIGPIGKCSRSKKILFANVFFWSAKGDVEIIGLGLTGLKVQ